MRREITITRVYEAPREAVWRAWTVPEELAAWWGKRGWRARLDSIVMDVRPGGTFRVTTVNDEDGSEMTNEGTYTEVSAPTRLAFGESVVTLADLGDGRTEMTFHTTLEASAALRDRAAGGLASAFGRLADHLDQGAAMGTATTIVTGVDYVGIPTQDIERAREFYAQVLGLEPSSVWQRSGEPAVGAEFETGTVTIALINCPALNIPFSVNPAPLALHVDDVAAARAQLEERGVEFSGDDIDSGVCHMANFKDPDGNAIMLHRRYAPKG